MKKSKQNYFGQLDQKKLNDSRKFRKIIKPFLNKGVSSNEMMITEKDTSLSEERAITEAITDIT